MDRTKTGMQRVAGRQSRAAQPLAKTTAAPTTLYAMAPVALVRFSCIVSLPTDQTVGAPIVMCAYTKRSCARWFLRPNRACSMWRRRGAVLYRGR